MPHKIIIDTEDSKTNDAPIVQPSFSSSALLTSTRNNHSSSNSYENSNNTENQIDEHNNDIETTDNNQILRTRSSLTKSKLLNDYRDPHLESLLSKLNTKQNEISQHRQQNLQQLENLKLQLKQLKHDADELNKQQKASLQQHQRNK